MDTKQPKTKPNKLKYGLLTDEDKGS